jgi:2-polyprenyl-3-methyl-5-hydroxy-6-metoxy-1,4-benzoquinol methylase
MMQTNSDRFHRISQVRFTYEAQPKIEVTHCNLCEHQYFTILIHRDRYGFPAKALACRRCGLVFLSPVMTKDAYSEFYGVAYRPLVSAYHGRTINAETIKKEQRIYAAILSELLRPYARKGHWKALLDIGGSTGVVAHKLAEDFEVRATVLDPAPAEIEQAHHMNLNTIVGLLEDFHPEGPTYDLITMCQTVDHLLDIKGAMRKVRQMIHPAGIFFVDIVDFRAAYLRSRNVEEAVKVDHPFYLTEATMEAFLTCTGFEVLLKDYANDHLHIGYICRPADPDPGFVPSSLSAGQLFQEVRSIQNLP